MNINGLLTLNKPKNITSNSAIQQIKKKFNLKKIGHCGTLDPIASGVLVICIGDKTKLSNNILNEKKTYIVTGILGIKSKTYDINGKIIFFENKLIKIKKSYIRQALKIIKNINYQKPPVYSSIKHNGLQLYKYARLNIKIIPKKKYITLTKIELIDKIDNLIILKITCSKGTYVRSIVNYLGKKIHIPIAINNIIRITSGSHNILKSYSLNNILNLKNIYDFNNILVK